MKAKYRVYKIESKRIPGVNYMFVSSVQVLVDSHKSFDNRDDAEKEIESELDVAESDAALQGNKYVILKVFEA